MADLILALPLFLLVILVTAQFSEILVGTGAPGRRTFYVCLALAALFPFALHWLFPQVAFGIWDEDGFTPSGPLILALMLPVTGLLAAAFFLIWRVIKQMPPRSRLYFALIMIAAIAASFVLFWLFPDATDGQYRRYWRRFYWR